MKEDTDIRLAVTDLTKKYIVPQRLFARSGENKIRTTKALDKVSFTLTPGLYGILGPNGAGKSTLINLITGTLLPNGGTVKWNDVNIKKLGRKYRRQIGYMPQQQTLYDSFTGGQFLSYMCALKEISREDTVREVEEAAEKVNLAGELSKRLSAYSGGMKQRLLTAGRILGHPKLMIFDEPTRGLDPKERYRLRSLLKELSRDSIVITATHVVSDVESVADEILLLRKGKLVDKAPVDVLIERYAKGGDLEQVYLNIFSEEGKA